MKASTPNLNRPMSPAACLIVERLLKYDEAAKLLGVTGRTVFTLIKTGKLPAVRFGRSVRIDPGDLRAFIDSAKRQPINDVPDMGMTHGQ